jgi:hypothetical protein
MDLKILIITYSTNLRQNSGSLRTAHAHRVKQNYFENTCKCITIDHDGVQTVQTNVSNSYCKSVDPIDNPKAQLKQY